MQMNHVKPSIAVLFASYLLSSQFHQQQQQRSWKKLTFLLELIFSHAYHSGMVVCRHLCHCHCCYQKFPIFRLYVFLWTVYLSGNLLENDFEFFPLPLPQQTCPLNKFILMFMNITVFLQKKVNKIRHTVEKNNLIISEVLT